MAPKVTKIVVEDNFALAAVMLVVFGVLFIPMIVVGIPNDAYVYLSIPFAAAVILIARVRLVRKVFATGEQVMARVASCTWKPAPGNLECMTDLAYNVRGEDYRIQKSVVLRKSWWKGPPFEIGDEVALIVDCRKPKRVFIRDRFY